MRANESNKEAEHEKENSKPPIKEEQKEEAVKESKKELKKDLIIVGVDVGQGKLQRRFEKFRKLRIVVYSI